jgi:hypothetical protein
MIDSFMVLCAAIVVTRMQLMFLALRLLILCRSVPIADHCDDNSDYSRIVKPLPVL